MRNVVFTITCKTEVAGSFFEILLGSLALAGVVQSYSATRSSEGEFTTIAVETICKEPPLKDIGMGDIPEKAL